MVRIGGKGSQQTHNVNKAQGKNQLGQNVLTSKVSDLANKVKATALPNIKAINQLPFSKNYPKSIAKEVGDVFRKTALEFTSTKSKTRK